MQGGYVGKIAYINLTKNKTESKQLEKNEAKKFRWTWSFIVALMETA